MNPMINELESLLLEWEQGTLDEQGVQRINDILKADEQALQYYVQHQVVEAALKLDYGTSLDLPFETQQSDSAHIVQQMTKYDVRKRSIFHYFSYTLVAFAFFALVGRLAYVELASERVQVAESNTSDSKPDEPTAQGVAIATKLVDIIWQTDQSPLESGDALPIGKLAIESGVMQIEFFCGATVVVEGPAELNLQSPLLVRVQEGRLRAHVPPAARGFSIEVDDLKVVDLGTEFGLSVSSEQTQIQVFDGEIELHQPNDVPESLTAGEGIVRLADGSVSQSTMATDDFLDIDDLESRATEQSTERYHKWKSWSDKIRRDERVIVYFAFDSNGSWNRRLLSSNVPQNEDLDGAIVGANRVKGRWESKSGLEFKRPGDQVRLDIPGEYHSLTFSTWVKIDSLDRWYNSLFLTDYYNQGEPHWQILDTGQLFFSVRHKPRDIEHGPTHHVVLSPQFWNPSMSGRWLHLATTYNADSGLVKHYLNGDQLCEEAIDPKLLVNTTRFGSASLGNWSFPTKPNAEFAIRNLNGTMDEFLLFSDELSEKEIKDIYENSKP